MVSRRVVAAAAAVLLGASATWTGLAVAVPEAARATVPQTCANRQGVGGAGSDGYQVTYPGGWYTNSGKVTAPCTYFDPEPFRVVPHSDVTDTAIRIDHRVQQPGSIVSSLRHNKDVVIESAARTVVDGRQAIGVQYVQTAGALNPAGTRHFAWYVSSTAGSLVLRTAHAPDEPGFAADKQITEVVVRSLKFLGSSP